MSQTYKDDIEIRAKEPPAGAPRPCVIVGCGRPAQRSGRNGLSDTLCKRHVEFQRRHGSSWRRSYLVRELAPYRRAAEVWLKAHQEDPATIRVIAALDGLIASGGKPVHAHEARWWKPKAKVRNVLARLHQAGKTGRQLLAIVLAVKATQAAIGPRANPEFRHVQIAKMTHRLASGTHTRSTRFVTISQYPRAEGIFMRRLGSAIEDIAAIVATSEAVEEVLSLDRRTP